MTGAGLVSARRRLASHSKKFHKIVCGEPVDIAIADAPQKNEFKLLSGSLFLLSAAPFLPLTISGLSFRDLLPYPVLIFPDKLGFPETLQPPFPGNGP